MKLRKAKTVVVAPNIEQIESEGGLDDLLGSILKQAEEGGLPVVFALSRKKMGQVQPVPGHHTHKLMKEHKACLLSLLLPYGPGSCLPVLAVSMPVCP